MPSLKVSLLSADHEFGACVSGLTLAALRDAEVRKEIDALFVDRGLVLFDDVETGSEMHIAVSNVFGPMQTHAYKGVPLVDPERLPGVLNISSQPGKGDTFRVDGKLLSGWIPWHFDACYTAKLNRGGVLRALEVPAEGGVTGFADGIQMYNALSPEWRSRLEGLEILYHPARMFTDIGFARPDDYEIIDIKQARIDMIENAKAAPRAVHPAVWQRPTGEKMLHTCAWQADGIPGMAGQQVEELLRDLFAEIERVMNPYYHPWKVGEMVAWDNTRLLHKACGHPPGATRVMHRTTIQGDYGLGRFEDGIADREPVLVMD